MAKQTISIGSTANDGTGSTIRAGGDLINDNFNEIYTAFGDGTNLNAGVITGKQEGANFANSIMIGHSTTGTLSAAEENVALGKTSLRAITSGDDNTAVGFAALQSVTTTSKSVAVGHSAAKTSSGEKTVAVGANAGIGLTTGNHNTFVGYNAGQTVETGSGNVIIGNAAGNTANETRTMIIAGSDGSTLTTWLEGDSTGEVVVFGNPTKNLGIATKQYVDSEITSAVAAENEISEMNDVTLTSIQTGDILQWNGSAFVNFALGTIGTMAAQNANAVNISGGSITMGSLSNASTVLIKDSSGSTLKTIIGTTS
jgi:hypothetical protein|tara:strand:+ start:3830 stop:4768 length:939 start_codon:yes stop_codon:yes gene_type:complete